MLPKSLCWRPVQVLQTLRAVPAWWIETNKGREKNMTEPTTTGAVSASALRSSMLQIKQLFVAKPPRSHGGRNGERKQRSVALTATRTARTRFYSAHERSCGFGMARRQCRA